MGFIARGAGSFSWRVVAIGSRASSLRGFPWFGFKRVSGFFSCVSNKGYTENLVYDLMMPKSSIRVREETMK
jgi:hypothetical protein